MAPTALRALLATAVPTRRRARSAVALVALAVAGLSCGERITAPQGQRSVAFAVAPSFTPRAALIEDALATFGLTVDNIHIQLTRSGGGVALDTVVPFPAGVDSVAVTLSLLISGNTEAFTALIELRQGTTVLFTGTQGVTLRLNPPSGGNAPEIPIEYVGPGSEAETITVSPADTTVAPGAAFQLQAVALDDVGDTVTNSPIDWRSLDEAIGTVDGTGNFTAVATRGDARIVAKLPNLVEDTAIVRIVPPATHLFALSGDNQTGSAGADLPAPVVVEVRAADNLPVPGVTVNIGDDLGGGSTNPFTAVSDALGRVSITWTLGTGVGAQAIRITSAGLADLVVNATSVAAAAASIVIIDQPEDTTTVGIGFDVPPRVELRDAFGNPRLVAGTNVTVALSPPAVGSIAGTTTVQTDANGQATFNGLQVNALVGNVTLTFTSGALPAVESDTIVLLRGPAALLTVEGGTGFNAPAGDSIPLAHAVRVTDAGLNPVDSFPLVLDQVDEPDTTVVTDSTGRFHLRLLGVPEVVGVYPLTFSGAGLTPVVVTVTVTAGAPAALSLSQAPSDTAVVANALLQQPRVQLRDAFGNVAPVAGVNVTAQAVGGAHTLGGTATVATNIAGVAIFTNLVINGAAGTAQLRFVAAGLDTVVSDTIVLFPALATKLDFTLEPGTPMAGNVFNVIVTAKDDFGNADPGFTGNVSVALGANPSSSTLGGTLVQAAVAGVATFSNLSLNNTGTGHTLVATSPGLAPDTTAAFEVITGVTYHDERRPGDIAIYKNIAAWFGENKDETVLQANPFKLAPGIGDYTVHPMSALLSGIPVSTSIVILTSASDGDAGGQIDEQQAAFANLDTWVRNGGWLVAHAGDNYVPDGYQIPGLTGIVDADTACTGLTPVPADHAYIRGPDAILGTGDDIVPFIMGVCSDNHGSLEGILPGNAEVLLRETGDLQRPVYATYTLGAGRVIVTTQSIEFVSHSTQALINHFYWALYGVNAPPAQPVVRNVNWVGGTGNWSDPTKWDIGMVPAVDDTVRIQGSGTDTVTVDNFPTAQTIIVGGVGGSQVLRVPNSLTVTDRLIVNPVTGTLFVDDGTINGTGAIDINGTLWVNYGQIEVSGAVTLATSSSTTLLGQVSRRFGPMAFNANAVLDGGSLNFGDGAVGTISASGVLELTGVSGQVGLGSGGGSLINNGLLHRTAGGGQFTLSVPFTNNSVVTVDTGTVRVEATGTYTHSGTWNLGTGGVVDIANGSNTLNGSVTGAGGMRFISANVTLAGATSLRRLAVNSGTVNATGNLTLTDTLMVLNGTLNLNTGEVVSTPWLQFDAGTIGGTDTLVVLDSLHWSGGTMSGASALVIVDTAVAALVTTSTKTLNTRRLDLRGQLWHQAGSFVFTNSLSEVAPTGIYSMAGDLSVSATGTSSLLNLGLVRKTGGTGLGSVTLPFTNDGVVSSNAGTFHFSVGGGSVTHSGEFQTNAPLARLEFSTSTQVFNGPLRALTGRLMVSNATLTFNDSLVVSGVSQINGTFTMAGPTVIADSARLQAGTMVFATGSTVSVPVFEQAGGVLQGTDSLIVSDSLLWTGGTMTGTGVTVLASGAVASLSTTAGRALSGGRAFTVAGDALWNGGGFTVSNLSVIDVVAGGEFLIDGNLTLSNGTGGGILSNAGRVARIGGTSVAIIGTQYGNTGQLDVLTGTLRYNNSGGPFTTSGPVNVSSGAILEFATGTHVVNSAVAGAGTLQQGSGTLTLGASPLVPVFALGNGTLNLSSGGVVTIPTLIQLNGTLQGTDTLVVTDSLAWSAGTQGGTGVTIVDSTAAAGFQTTSGRTLTGGRQFLLRGYGVHDGGTWSLGGGAAFVVDTVGTLETRGDVGFSPTTGGGTFLNTGTMVKTIGTGAAVFSVPFVNDGDVAILSGTLRVSPPAVSSTHTGAFAVTAPGVLEFASSGTHALNGGAFGTGTLLTSNTVIVNVGVPLNIPALHLNGGTLSFAAGAPTTVSLVNLAAGALQGTDTVFVTDSLHWVGGAMNGTGVTYVHDTASVVLATTGSRSLNAGRALHVEGDFIVQAGSLSFGGGSTLITDTLSAVSLQGAISINTTAGSGTWTHRGALARETAVGAATVSVPFTNEGTVDVGIGSLVLSAAGVFAHTGDFVVNAPATLTLSTGTHNVSGTVTGTGITAVTAGTSSFSNAFGAKVFNSTGGATNFTGGVSGLDTLRATGGTLTFSSAETFAVPYVLVNGGVVQGIDTLVVTDTLEWSSGTMGGTGRTVIPVGVGAHFSSTSTKSLLGGRSMAIEGTAHWSGGTIALTASPLSIAATGEFTIAAAASVTGASGATFVNGGLLRRTTTGTATISAPFVNAGTLEVTAGLLSIANPAGTHTHTGPFVVTAPGTLEFAGVGTQVVDSSVTGTGFGRTSSTNLTVNGSYTLPSIVASGGAATFAGSVGPLDTLRNTTGTLSLNTGSTVAVDRLFLASGTVQGSDSIVVLDSMDWAGGTMGGTAATHILDTVVLNLPTTSTKLLVGGRSLLVDGDARWGGGGWQLGNGSQVVVGATGDLEVTANVAMTATTGGGLLQNNGSIRRTAGTGSFSVATRFANQGTVETFTGNNFFTSPDTVVHTGSWHPQASTMLTVGGHTQTFDGPFVGTGRVTLSGTVTTVNDTMDVGTILMANGTTTINGPVLPLDSLQINGGTSITFATGQTIETAVYSQVAGLRLGADTILVLDTLSFGGGTMGGTGVTMSTDTTVAFLTGTKNLADAHVLSLGGPSTWSAGSFVLANSSQLRVAPTGTLNVTATLTASGTGTFLNEGVTTKSAGTGAFTIGSAFSNVGTLAVNTGSISLSAAGGTFVHSGPFTTAAGSFIIFNGAATHQLDSTLTGLGGATFNAGTTILNGTLDVPSAHYAGGNLTINGPFIVADSMRATVATTQFTINSNVFIPVGSLWSMRGSNAGIVGSGSITNFGTFLRSTSNTADTIAVPFDNAGVVSGTIGTLAFTRAFTHQSGAALYGGTAAGATAIVSFVPDSIVAWEGSINPGPTAAGRVTINGLDTVSTSGVINIELGGTTLGTQYDQLILGSQTIVGGTLNVSLINAFVPASGNVFTIMTYPVGTPLPSFGTMNLPAGITAGMVNIGSTSVTITIP